LHFNARLPPTVSCDFCENPPAVTRRHTSFPHTQQRRHLSPPSISDAAAASFAGSPHCVAAAPSLSGRRLQVWEHRRLLRPTALTPRRRLGVTVASPRSAAAFRSPPPRLGAPPLSGRHRLSWERHRVAWERGRFQVAAN
jgi:hypothetical protein